MNDLKFQLSGSGLVWKPSSRNLVAVFGQGKAFFDDCESFLTIGGQAANCGPPSNSSLSYWPFLENRSSTLGLSHGGFSLRWPSPISAYFGGCPLIRFNAAEFAFFCPAYWVSIGPPVRRCRRASQICPSFALAHSVASKCHQDLGVE